MAPFLLRSEYQRRKKTTGTLKLPGLSEISCLRQELGDAVNFVSIHKPKQHKSSRCVTEPATARGPSHLFFSRSRDWRSRCHNGCCWWNTIVPRRKFAAGWCRGTCCALFRRCERGATSRRLAGRWTFAVDLTRGGASTNRISFTLGTISG